jgi:hypothetical protein
MVEMIEDVICQKAKRSVSESGMMMISFSATFGLFLSVWVYN